ncbi:YceD family protein [Sphingomicrobium lutaoense]|uniref:Uncharacterized metal-binding protein YceD (DUF177 family) n=1 Tax=Sphingomicrobium lutaoense TaxID=515949 RepID=A0A839Z0Q2_9SPHN|nr:YceD family protein [Sphingomicrobium lutaoense]MBB3764846.1 uncharacterized metal-binding protein YceD (DUF177 family) [Sphingomicrobium lutaoense]
MIDPIRLSEIRDGDRIDVTADEKERAAIADRLGLEALEHFSAHAVLHRDGEAVSAEGRVKADAVQACVATGEPVPEHVDEAFAIRFIPAPIEGGEEEVELDEGEMDVVFHDGARIELGDALVDTLSLSLEPYPRSPNADAELKRAGVLSEEEAGPFGALSALKKKTDDQP